MADRASRPSRLAARPHLHRSATLSSCGAYRYALARIWFRRAPPLHFVMLNPSTADAERDDPTICRCMSFARREGFGGIYVTNLFAYRATNPQELLSRGGAAFGPENELHLAKSVYASSNQGAPIVCAWGAHRAARELGGESIFLELAQSGARPAKLLCLGKAEGGAPRHPLYVRADQKLESFP